MTANVFMSAVDESFEKRLREPEQRDHVVSAVMLGFDALRKKPVGDLEQRTKEIEKRVRLMLELVKLGFVNGRLVVTVDGASESLMNQLRFGSDWFEPWEKVDEVLVAAILTDPVK